MKARSANGIRGLVGFSVLALASLLVLMACQPSGGFQGVPGFSKGIITAKGSIFVNGIEYDTLGSQIKLDNLSGSDSDLQVGMVVGVKGQIDTATGKGIADQVEYTKSIEGTVDATPTLTATGGSFAVFGVTVTVDAATVFKDIAGLSALAAGNQVEVSGIVKASGILASRVALKTSGDYDLKGTISGLGPSSFSLSTENGTDFTVNFTGTLDPAITNGSLVEVEFSSAPSGGSLSTTASKIQVESRLEASNGERAELEGVVLGYAAGPPATFKVQGIDVSVPATVTYSGSLANGVQVKVEGTMSGTTLVASSVRLHKEADIEIEGSLASVSAGAGGLVLNGVALTADSATIYRDEAWSGHTPVEHFGIADLAAGDHLQAKAYLDGTSLVAARIERSNPSGTQDAELRGLATAKSGASITVLGVTIDATSLSGYPVSPNLSTDYVKFSGTVAGGVITWTAVQIDN